jgi:Ino eighty subunit 1
MAPVVTGPKRTNKKVFTQNPVFSVLADDGASTPERGRQSPSHGTESISKPLIIMLTTMSGSARGRSGKLAKSIIERDYGSDTDRTRSVSPPVSIPNTGKKMPNMRINTLLNDEAPVSTPAPKGPGRGNWSRKGNASAKGFTSRLEQGNSQDGQSPAGNAPTFSGPHGFYLPLNGSDPAHKRTRPLTQHQLAVEQYRRRRVEVILDRGIRVEYRAAAKRRRAQSSFLRAWIRCKGMQDGYDTDDDSNTQAPHQADADAGIRAHTPIPAGLIPIDFGGEVDDHGEEAYYRTKMLSRTQRRMDRWEEKKSITRSKPKSSHHRHENGGSALDDRDDEYGSDEDMQDVEDALERRDEDEDMDSEDEDDRVYDPHTLPPLPASTG